MSKRIAVAVAASVCGAVVMAMVLTSPNPTPTPQTHSPHGEFGTRLQPRLDGIGSTRELASVVLALGTDSQPAVHARELRVRR